MRTGHVDFPRTWGAAGVKQHVSGAIRCSQHRSWSCALARCTGEGHLRPPMARPPNRRRSQAHRVSLLQASFLPQVDGEHLRVSLKPCFD